MDSKFWLILTIAALLTIATFADANSSSFDWNDKNLSNATRGFNFEFVQYIQNYQGSDSSSSSESSSSSDSSSEENIADPATIPPGHI